ncbi:MAG TPA: hypothetical protein VIT00_04200 [Terrimicrobiaceae bacterium]
MATVLCELAESWRRKVSRFGLTPGDTKAVGAVIKIAEALRVRASESGLAEVDYRTFSRSTTDDSKALDRLKVSAISILRAAYTMGVAALGALAPSDLAATGFVWRFGFAAFASACGVLACLLLPASSNLGHRE